MFKTSFGEVYSLIYVHIVEYTLGNRILWLDKKMLLVHLNGYNHIQNFIWTGIYGNQTLWLN